MEKILVVEDNPDIQTQMKWGISSELEVLQASDKKSALSLFEKHQPKVVTLDLGLPPDAEGTSEGFGSLKQILSKAPHTKVIVITGNTDRENALKAVQMGAYDYFLKPVDMNEIKVIIKRAFHLSEIEDENRNLHIILDKDIGFGGMIGQHPEMIKVFEIIEKVATADATVLVTGESGTGKELVVRAIHERSARNKGPFIPINCGAIPETLLEAELFGHEKGSFTGAYAMQKGKVEYADKGTLLLDEISEMSPRLQTKLLRFLQERKIQRIGGRSDIEIDVRVVAATNIDLQSAIKEGTFREDLFYRISVVTIALPPLRNRGMDVRLLAKVFLERYNAAFRKKFLGFSHAALSAIENYPWPGNIRELENKLQRAVIMSEGDYIEPQALGFAETAAEKREVEDYESLTLKDARKKLDIDLIESSLDRNKGNIKNAAKELGISRPTFYDMISKYGLGKKYNLE